MSDRLIPPGWATYLRVSDEDKQTPERSFAMQRQRIQEHLILGSDIPFKSEYCDMLTGTNPNRADYQRLLADAEAGRFTHLGLYRADRFGRNTVEGLQAANKLMAWGIKIRVAHMPSLMPETPDGFFMFLLQMGMAQREVDVLRQRTRDGTEVKFRAGFWPNKAPEGYVNKENQIKSGKYDRWVEKDPIHCEGLRAAWNLLLTGRYTLDQICNELSKLGYARSNGQPWSWVDPTSGKRHNARSSLHKVFHNPFYAGWVVSRCFGIAFGEIRGKWDPLISTDEYTKGIEILNSHDDDKSRVKKQFYLLRNLLFISTNSKLYKLFGTTPTGRSKSYSYYATLTKIGDKNLHIPCEVIDAQIPSWLSRITVGVDLLPKIREFYRNQIKQTTQEDKEVKLSDLKRRALQLKEEEAKLGRLLITGKISEETFDQLRMEWQEKIRNSEIILVEMEKETSIHLDDLEAALILLSKVSTLYPRLTLKEKTTLLQIIARRIIVDLQGTIITQELNTPFAYLRTLADDLVSPGKEGGGSDHVHQRQPVRYHHNQVD